MDAEFLIFPGGPDDDDLDDDFPTELSDGVEPDAAIEVEPRVATAGESTALRLALLARSPGLLVAPTWTPAVRDAVQMLLITQQSLFRAVIGVSVPDQDEDEEDEAGFGIPAADIDALLAELATTPISAVCDVLLHDLGDGSAVVEIRAP